jgi:DNA-directed RNA polymerase specialized sigma24 family protein
LGYTIEETATFTRVPANTVRSLCNVVSQALASEVTFII